MVEQQGRRKDWSLKISGRKTKYQILSYTGRYVRHPPISNRRIVSYSDKEVVFTVTEKWTYEELVNKIPDKVSKVSISLEDFIERLAMHVQGNYRHAMRYFGLLAPRRKRLAMPAVFKALGQTMRQKPKRQSRAEMLKKHFGIDVTKDSFGERLVRIQNPKSRRYNRI